MYMISEERTRKRNIGLERGEGLCEFTKVKKVELILYRLCGLVVSNV